MSLPGSNFDPVTVVCLSVCSLSDKCHGSVFEVVQKHVISNTAASQQSISCVKQIDRQVTYTVNKRIQASVS